MQDANESIIKLVFLREMLADGQAGRKAVVPLVEGADFDHFLSRVRGRLALPADHPVSLLDEDHQVVESIERLLEVDESSTLAIVFDPLTQCAASCSGTASAARRTTAAKPQVAAASAGASPSCRVDIGTSPSFTAAARAAEEAEGGETGALKYRKRRGGLVATFGRLSRLRRWVIVLSVLAAVTVVALRVLAV